MGQFFKAVVERPDCVKVFSYPGYYKLTEHSWCTNAFTDAIMKDLHHNGPAKVAWIGDYAKDFYEKLENIEGYDYNERYVAAWCDSDVVLDLKGRTKPIERIEVHESGVDPEFTPERLKKMNFVNLTQERTLNMQKYISLDEKEERLSLFPLSMLTACGNGNGSGDYFGDDLKSVGTWAFDEIALMDAEDVPEGFEEEDRAHFNLFATPIAYTLYERCHRKDD